MEFDLQEALDYYRRQGAPGDQNALVGLLREIQQEQGGRIPGWCLERIGEAYGIKVTFLRAVIRRIPSLRLQDSHCLELCAGPNCPKRADLATFVEKTWGTAPKEFTLRYVPCMRMCGKGPNLRWDGKVYNGADEALIKKLIQEKEN